MKTLGSCLCGKIQFQLLGAAEFPHACACRTCQLFSGAPLMGWAEFPREGLTWLKERPKLYRSSPGTQRAFCPHCGSSLMAFDDGSEWVSVGTACLDPESEVPVPESTSFAEGLPPWLQAPPEWKKNPES